MEINVEFKDRVFVRDVMEGQKLPMHFNDKSVTLFWSGGVDSTYMLFWLLAHGYYVRTIYCDLENNSFKSRREMWSRKKIRQWAEKYRPELIQRWDNDETPVLKIEAAAPFRSALAQAPIWLLGTQLASIYPETYVMAYVNGDDALQYIRSFNKIMEGYAMLSDPEKRPAELLFPMMGLKKAWFYEALRPLYGMMTWCEYPVLKKNCGCVACTRHRYEVGHIEV